MSAALEMRNVDAGYGAFRALFDVSFTVEPGEAVALVGPNGAGKTTIARVASGLIAPTSGTISVDGTDVTGKPSYEFARAGVAHAPEGRSVFGTLTVEENLVLSIHRIRGRRGVKAGLTEAFELFPQARRPAESDCRNVVWWRTAHACHGEGARRRTQAAHRRRTLAGPRAHHRRPHVRKPRAPPRRWHCVARHRATCLPHVETVRPRHRDGARRTVMGWPSSRRE